jgi:Fe-Mn family superoxide dismutase
MPFELPPLPYSFDALEPHIDARTMEIHHDKHHQAYVTNANAALAGTALVDAPVEEVLRKLDTLPADKQGPVRNNAGGHYNHSLFWEIMGPNGGGDPTGDLLAAIQRNFHTVDELRKLINATGVSRFGSGWTWLVVDGGSLAVISTANQDAPISDGKTPILGIDVWEHAYYLKYQNRRPDYLAAWWSVVNWEAVAGKYAAATAK